MVNIKSIRYRDIIQFRKIPSLECTNLSSYQMSKGLFSGTLKSINLGKSSIGIGESHSKILSKGILPKDKITFITILKVVDNMSVLKAHKITKNMLFCLDEHSEISSVFTPGILWVSFQIPRKELELLGFDFKKYSNTFINATNKHARIASKKIHHLINHLYHLSQEELLYLSPKEIHKNILSIHLDAFNHTKKLNKVDKESYRIIATKTYDYILAHSNYTITMHDLSKAIKTSERTLQRAFKLYYHTTLQNFIKIHRLHKVRQKLLASSPNETITEIAFDNGFSHLGRFAQNYKNLFGELPSDTYKRT